MEKCNEKTSIEDECSIISYKCEKEDGHSGRHLTHYPGQWGGANIPVEWESDSEQKIEFYRNNFV